MTYCTIDPGQGHRYLVLPRGWNDNPRIGTGQTILDVDPTGSPSRLYILSHGSIWFDYPNREYWRLLMPGGYCPPHQLYSHPITGLWSTKPSHLPIRAEQVDYETLRLEGLFGYSVWGGGQ
jgi:hypothetical protein